MRKVLVGALVILVGAMFVPVGGSSPETHTVVRGDTLGEIAATRGVSVAQLRSWNGITGDLIEVDQVLDLGESGPGTPVWQGLRSRFGKLTLTEDAVAVEAPTEEEAPGPKKRRRRKKSRARQQPEPPSEIDEEAPSWRPLTMPAAKTCLDEMAGLDEGSFGRSQGLDVEQVRSAVGKFERQTLRCFDGRPQVVGEVMLDLTVGCDGRVRRSSVDSHDTGSNDFALCVAEVFRYASFPAHARDEVEFSVPLRFSEGG